MAGFLPLAAGRLIASSSGDGTPTSPRRLHCLSPTCLSLSTRQQLACHGACGCPRPVALEQALCVQRRRGGGAVPAHSRGSCLLQVGLRSLTESPHTHSTSTARERRGSPPQDTHLTARWHLTCTTLPFPHTKSVRVGGRVDGRSCSPTGSRAGEGSVSRHSYTAAGHRTLQGTR